MSFEFNFVFFSCLDAYRTKCLLSMAPINAVRGFRTSILRKSRQSSRPMPKFGQMDTQFEGVKVESGPIQFSKLWKPLCFTAVVSHSLCTNCLTLLPYNFYTYKFWMNDVFIGVQSQNSLYSIFRLYMVKIATCLQIILKEGLCGFPQAHTVNIRVEPSNRPRTSLSKLSLYYHLQCTLQPWFFLTSLCGSTFSNIITEIMRLRLH